MAMAESLVMGLVYLNSCLAVDGAGNPNGFICANARDDISNAQVSNLNLFIILFTLLIVFIRSNEAYIINCSCCVARQCLKFYPNIAFAFYHRIGYFVYYILKL